MAQRRRLRRPPPRRALSREVMLAQLSDLELRVKLLEAKLRRLNAAQAEAEGAPPATRRVRERPRCPGCHLELPVGRRGEECVWCGFRFDGVTAKFSRSRARK